MGILSNARSGIQSAINRVTSVPRDVVGGTKDYMRENKKASDMAMKTVGDQQHAMVEATMRHEATRTPMGENEFYGRVGQEYKKNKKKMGVSLVGSIKKRLANPND